LGSKREAVVAVASHQPVPGFRDDTVNGIGLLDIHECGNFAGRQWVERSKVLPFINADRRIAKSQGADAIRPAFLFDPGNTIQVSDAHLAPPHPIQNDNSLIRHTVEDPPFFPPGVEEPPPDHVLANGDKWYAPQRKEPVGTVRSLESAGRHVLPE